MTMSAEEVAEAVGGPTTPFSPERGELSTLFHWFEDKDRLCVIAGDPSMKAQATDVGFAHALGHLGDRDLIVVFPEAGATAVAQRLPFLDIPSASFVLRDTGVERLQPLRPGDVIASFKGPRGGSHDVSKALALIEPLVRWLDDEKALVKDDRQSYRSWQYRGRQVLTLRVGTEGGVHLVAGVNYSKPAPGLAPLVLRVDEPISEAELLQVRTAIAVARARRDSGEDIANAEHLLQEKLRETWDLLDLRDAPLREVPVRRPVGYDILLGYLAWECQPGLAPSCSSDLAPPPSFVVSGRTAAAVRAVEPRCEDRRVKGAADRGVRRSFCCAPLGSCAAGSSPSQSPPGERKAATDRRARPLRPRRGPVPAP